MVILDKIEFKPDAGELFKRLHMDPGHDEAGEAVRLLDEAVGTARPRGLYTEAFIDDKGPDYVVIGNLTFTSKVLRINLENNFKVYPYLATCGVELEEWSRTKKDIVENYWADTIKMMAEQTAYQAILAHFNENCRPGKFARMSPGSLENWPLTEQKKLFALIGNTKEAIGVELTDSCLMLPSKSVSGIWFSTETDFESCALCERRNCPGRRAPYNAELQKKYI